MASESLKTAINGTYITKDTLEEIKSIIIDVQEVISVKKATAEKLKELSDSLISGQINAKKRKQWNELFDGLKHIWKQYDSIKAEEDDEESDEDAGDDIEVPVKINETIDELESRLDSAISEYRFSKDKPMYGVTLNDRKTYTVKMEDGEIKVNTKSKTLDNACKRIIAVIQDNYYHDAIFINKINGNESVNQITESLPIKKFSFSCHQEQFIVYCYQNELYFDLNHIVKKLDLKIRQHQNIIKDNTENVVYCFWHKNSFGGYILRRLISEASMHKIILHSNSKFSQAFLDDVVNIIVQLRKDNKLTINNEGRLVLANNQSHQMVLSSCVSLRYYSYNEPCDAEVVYSMIRMAIHGDIASYLNENIMYGFIMPVPHPHNLIITKFGYSCNLVERYKSLKKTYDCEVFLVKLKLIKNESIEKSFHASIQKFYPSMHYEVTIKGQKKTELYYFNPVLMSFFDNYNGQSDKILQPTNPVITDNDFNDMITANHVFLDVLKGMNLENKERVIDYLVNKDNTRVEIEKQRTEQERLRTEDNDKQRTHEKEKWTHESKMIDKQIELTKLQSKENDKQRTHELKMAKMN